MCTPKYLRNRMMQSKQINSEIESFLPMSINDIRKHDISPIKNFEFLPPVRGTRSAHGIILYDLLRFDFLYQIAQEKCTVKTAAETVPERN